MQTATDTYKGHRSRNARRLESNWPSDWM